MAVQLLKYVNVDILQKCLHLIFLIQLRKWYCLFIHYCHYSYCCFSSTFLVAMYREPSLHDVGEAVPKLVGGPPSKSTTSEPVVMNGGKPVNKPDKEET